MKRLFLILLPAVLWAHNAPQLLKEPPPPEGLHIDAFYYLVPMGNPVGGLKRGFTAPQSLWAQLTYKRNCLEFYCSGIYNSGSDLNKKVGTPIDLASVWGGETGFLFELYALRRFSWGHVKAGRIAAGNNFMTSDLFWWYVSGAFAIQPDAIFTNVPSFIAYPNAAWGAYVQWDIHKKLSAKAAIYNANERVFENRFHGLNFTFENEEGYFLISEVIARPCETVLRFGGYYLTGESTSELGGGGRGNYGVYLIGEQNLYASGPHQITAWAAVLACPKEQNTIPFSFYTGIVAEGWIGSRPNDGTAFGLAYARYRPEGRTHEMLLELNHGFQLSDWLSITPSLQYIINPGGVQSTANALILGVQILAVF